MEHLSQKTLVMLIAPSAVGKSTILQTAIELDDECERVRGFTTRKPRPNDAPEQFFYLGQDELAEKKHAGELVSEVVFPTTGESYGTLKQSFSGHYCLLETLANSVEMYRQLPFKQTIAVSLTTMPEQWQSWFSERYPVMNDEAKKRLKEAVLSIEWSLAQTSNHVWLVNDGTPDEVATRLVAIIKGEAAGDDGASHARAIMELAKQEV